jgi:oligopeptide/dipeptide ABC transporter ATP-binding protein
MYAGKPVEIGTVEDIYYNPRMPYTLGLLGSLPRLDKREQERLTPIQGGPPSLVNLPPGCPFTPRCPLAQEICQTREPDLEPVDGSGFTAAGMRIHLSACHFKEQVARQNPADLFTATATDASLPAEFGGAPGAVEIVDNNNGTEDEIR